MSDFLIMSTSQVNVYLITHCQLDRMGTVSTRIILLQLQLKFNDIIWECAGYRFLLSIYPIGC